MRFLMIVCAVFLTTISGWSLDVRAAMKSKYDTTNEYPVALLKFILDKSGVPYTITFADIGITTQAREVALLKGNDRINIGWYGTSAELEHDLVPVRYPIWRGLLGHRVFIINKSSQPAFDKVNTLEDLQKFRGEQGIGWSDIQILEASGLRQEQDPKDIIFAKINAGRTDYFARGITEAFREIEIVGNDFPNLVVEKHLLLVYRFAAFFFTNKDNPELSHALEEGFRRAYADGSFLKFFNSYPAVKTVLAKANLKDRVRIDIPNPLLTPETRAIPEMYWNEK
jgi:hypothetical protein